MGYHLSILRSEGNKKYISKEDIDSLVDSMDELTFEGSKQDGVITIKYSDNGLTFLMFYQNGEIWTKNPDERIIELMLVIANKLDARLRGDEFETYRTVNDTYIHDDDKQEYDNWKKFVKLQRAKRLKQSITSKVAVVALFMLLGLIVMSIFDLK